MKKIIVPNTIAFLITKKCTAQCKICCFECSPKCEEKMPEQYIEKVINESESIKEIKTIGFSGGEPFLEYKTLLKMSSLAKEKGKRVICTSNGFWGKTFEKALEIVKEIQIAGIDKLSLSVDLYHNEYIEIENIKNILMASNTVSLPVDIGSVITKDKCKLSILFDAIAEEMINVPHYTAACLPVGTAIKQINESEYIYDSFIFERSNRCFETTYLAVFPSGDVFPCCSQAGATEPLKIGNIKTQSLNDLYKSYNSNMHLRILKQEGLNWYIELANQLGYKEYFNKEYVSKCDLCRRIFDNGQFMEMIAPYIEKEKQKIYEKYIKSCESNTV